MRLSLFKRKTHHGQRRSNCKTLNGEATIAKHDGVIR
jgi:hypothetical protein